MKRPSVLSRLFSARRWWLRVIAVSLLMGVLGLLALNAWFPFPLDRLEGWPRSPQVYDRHGSRILGTVGVDDGWRDPVPLESMGDWLPLATIAVEDERFFAHYGVDPLAVIRATGQNVSSGRIVSGASTITMQVCKMMDDPPRTWRAKIHESLRAIQLERLLDKRGILEHYLNLAPYGGNLRGVEVAARRYFGKASRDLTLGEASLIAGLPQSPSRYRPDRYLARARKRQRTVLARMLEQGFIGEVQYGRALEESLHIQTQDTRPSRILEHGAWWALGRRPEGGVTTFDLPLQGRVEQRVRAWGEHLPEGSDVAVVVLHIPSAELRSMVGSLDPADPVDGQVNGAVVRRSPGSTLKPFIYGTAFETGRLHADSPVDDRAIVRAGWRPENFDGKFHGRVTTGAALRRSLNVPAILVAEAVGLSACVDRIQRAGVTLPANTVERSGLALVTGATEVSLLQLTNGYATLGRGGRYRPVQLWLDAAPTVSAGKGDETSVQGIRVFEESTCQQLAAILGSQDRVPRGQEHFTANGRPWFLWKTGTSSGRRDAWAVGHNQEWAIGVWVGAFSGVGHPTYVGGVAAEPLLAELFSLAEIVRYDVPPWAGSGVPLEDRAGAMDLTCSRSGVPVIEDPENGAVYIAVRGQAVLHPRARPASVQWFLNGRLLASTVRPRLELTPGSYELRAVDARGGADAVRFWVR